MSKKNIKNNKKNSNHKNFKIEALEPRLMMSADPQFDPNANDIDTSLSALSVDLENAVENGVLNHSGDINTIGLSFKDSSSNDISEISQILAQNVELVVKSDAVNAFTAAKEDVKAYIDKYNDEHKSDENFQAITSVGTSEYLAYVKSHLQNVGSCTISGSKIDVVCDYEGEFKPNEINFAEDYLGDFTKETKFSVKAKVSFSVDLNNDGNDIPLETGDVVSSVSFDDVSISLNNVGLSTKFMNLELKEQSDSTKDIEITNKAGNLKSSLNLEFNESANFDVFSFKRGDNLKFTKVDGNAPTVEFPDVKMEDDFTLAKIKDVLKTDKLPFLDAFNLDISSFGCYTLDKIDSLFGKFNEYWARTSLALNGIFDVKSSKMDFSNFRDYFDLLVKSRSAELSKVLKNLNVRDVNDNTLSLLDKSSDKLSDLTIGDSSNPTSLYLDFGVKVGNFADKIDFKLFELDNFDVEFNFTIKIDVFSDGSKFCFQGLSFDSLDITVKKTLSNQSLHMGLFDTTISGEFAYTIKVKSGQTTSDIRLSCSSIKVESGNVTIYENSSPTQPLDVVYKIDDLVWEFPKDVRSYFSLTADTLATQTASFLTSLQTALRSQVEKKVKIDFLSGSVDKVVDVLDSIKEIVYDESGAAASNAMFVLKDGAFKPNFDNPETFVAHFNSAWSSAFPSAPASVCTLKYVGKIKDKDFVFSDVTKLDTDQKKEFVFTNYQLELALSFGKSENFDLNFAKSLESYLANIATFGTVSVSCNANITCNLDIMFNYKSITGSTTLTELFGSKYVVQNNTYYESAEFKDISFKKTETLKVDGKDYDSAFQFKIDDKIVLVKAGENLSSTTAFKFVSYDDQKNEYKTLSSAPNVQYKTIVDGSNRLVVTAASEFDVVSSGNADSFAELKLINTVLQTCFTTTVTAGTKEVAVELSVVNPSAADSDKTLKLNVKNISEYATDLYNRGLSKSSNWVDCLDSYLSLQKTSEDKLGLNSLGSLENGRSIKNTYGLYVIAVKNNEIQFGCDPSLIKGYKTERSDKGKIEVKSVYYTLLKNSGSKYMRMSGALTASGAVGDEVGLLLEKYSVDDLGSVTYNYSWIKSEPTTYDLQKEYDESEKNDAQDAVDKLNEAIENVSFDGKIAASLTELSVYNQSTKKDDVWYTIGAAPVNNEEFCWRIDSSDLNHLVLEKYQVVEHKLSRVESINLRTTLIDLYDVDTAADAAVENLKDELGEIFKNEDVFDVTKVIEGSNFKIKIASKKTEVYRVVKSDKFMSITVGGKPVYINTENCADLADLSRTIKKELEINGIDETTVVSVDRIGAQVVFATVGKTTLKCDKLAIDSSASGQGTTDDFSVDGVGVDFEDLDIDDDGTSTTHKISENDDVAHIVAAINKIISGTGVELLYQDPDTSKADREWDHLEFRSNNSFVLENIDSSMILEKLGFTAMMSSKYGDSDYRIVGKALLGIDWSKLIQLNEGSDVVMKADLSFDIGAAFTATSKTEKDGVITLNVNKTTKLPLFVIGGFVQNGDDYFKITKLNKDNTGALVSIEFSKEPMSMGSTKADWNNLKLKYVAGISATAGFINVDLLTEGSVGIEAEFTARKNLSSRVQTDSFLSKFEFSPTLTVTGKKEFSVTGLVSGLTSSPISLGTNTISLDVNKQTSLPQVSFDTTGIKAALDKFDLGSFSMQNVYAMLDGLVKRLNSVAESYSNVKIPVINKSLGDLVNVANDIRDIVNKLRKDNIVSLQGLSDCLNKYLEDAKLVASAKNLKLFGIKISGKKIAFNFDVVKAFSSVHDFNFGGANAGISGSAKLNVTGDFWFKLSAELDTDGDYDFILGDAVKFGADIKILGEKLSFNLGVNGNSTLLKELITVGSNKNDSLVVGQAALTGSFGLAGLSLVNWELPDDPTSDEDPVIPLTFSLPMVIYGKLPVSVKGYELGYIEFGKCDGNSILKVSDNDDASKKIKNKDAAVNTIIEKKASDTSLVKPLEVKLFTKKSDFSTISEKTDNLVIDFSSVYEGFEKILTADIDWFNKIRLAVTGLNGLLDSLESSINSGLMSSIKNVPVVGSALSNGVDFLSKLKEQVLEPFSDFVYESTGLTAEMVAQKMSKLFYGYTLKNDSVYGKLNVAGSGWSLLDGSDSIYYKQDSDSAEWFFTLGKNYSFGKNLGLDLGFPGLGLETEAGLNLGLDWTLNFGMKVSKDGGFEFVFSDQSDVQIKVNANLDGKVKGKLAGLGVQLELGKDKSTHTEAKSKNQGVNLSLTVDLDQRKSNNGDISKDELEEKSLSDILSNVPQFDFDAYVNMLVKMTVGVASDVSKDTPKFPNITGNFDFFWDNGTIKKLAFSDFELDMGSFISGVLGPIVSKIQKVVEPLKPLVDFLTTPFPVLKDLDIIITPLDLAKEYSKGKFDDSMVYAIKDLIALSEKIAAFGSGKKLAIKLGSMDLIGGTGLVVGSATDADDFAKGSKSLKDLDVGSYLSKESVDAGKNANDALSKNGFKVGDGAWRFVWDNPTDVFKLLLGQDIDLVHYDMPKLSFGFDWSTFIRIWAPLGVRLGVSLDASIDLAFGYDTLGIRQWVGSDYKDFGRLLNGFYVDDLDKNGNDKNELLFHGGLKASAELNAGVSAGVGGGVDINVGFNLFDPNKDGKLRLSEMKTLLNEEGLFGMFDVEGEITAKLYAYLDLYLYRDEWNITDDITLFEFKYTHTVQPVMISKSGDDVVANIGSNASSRVSTEGVNKTLTDGDEILYLSVNGSKVSDDYDHSETVKGKLIVNAEKGNDKIIIENKSNGDAAANFDIIINGGDGDDIIDLSNLRVADGHYVLITGGAGADNIIGAQGLNIIFGDAYTKDPEIEIDADSKKLTGLVAEANIYAEHSGGDSIQGGSKQDIIFGGAGDDHIDGDAGEDYIFGDGGRVEYSNGSWNISRTDVGLDGGNDILVGGADDDVIYGGGGDDHIDGGAGVDDIHGEKGHDRILGGSGNDTISGGEGMDIIFGDRIVNKGMDVADPFFALGMSQNTDAFSQEFVDAQFKNGSSITTQIAQSEFEIDIKELDKKGTEIINKHIASTDTSVDYGNDTINGNEGNDLIFGDDGANGSSGGADIINGGIGNDIINGEGGNDTIKGGIDNDIIYGGDGNDIIDGGAGNDSLYGDRGATDYATKKVEGKDEVDAGKLLNSGNGKNSLVFGDNLGLHGVIYENAKSKTEGGNDKITTGPGMDFVDGQGGNDKVVVNLMGESSVGYANVTNSGQGDLDQLVVEGTETDDNLLMRRSKDEKLGFIALLPQTADENNLSLNTNIERVNFTAAIKNVNLNANGGNDTIVVDGTAETTNIDGGAGSDTIQVGQLYNSDRKYLNGLDSDPAMVQPVDEFGTVETNEEKYLSDGVTANTILNVDGNIDRDIFVSLNNVGKLNMAGGKGNDDFSIYGFLNKDGKAIARGSMSLDGGLGNDALFVRGTDGDDTVIIDKKGTLSNVVSVKTAGIETSTFDAAAGDDLYNVIGNNEGEVHSLNGGKGNDTFSIGGLDKEYTMRSSETDGQNCDIRYELLDEKGNVVGDSIESYTVYDTSKEPVVFVSSKSDSISLPEITISEDKSTGVGVGFFYLHYAGDKIDGKAFKEIVVNLTAPMLSEKAKKSGAREIMLAQVSDSDEAFSSTWDLTSTLPVTFKTAEKNTYVKIAVCCFSDNLVEPEELKSISISSECDGVGLTKSITSVAVKIEQDDSQDRSAEVAKLLAEAEEFTVSGEIIQLCDIAKDTGVEIKAYVVGKPGFLTKTDKTTFETNKANSFYVENGVMHVDPSLQNKTLVVLYRAGTMRIDGSKAHLAYDDVNVKNLIVKYTPDASTSTTAGATSSPKQIWTKNTAPTDADVYFDLQGDTIVFYNKSNNRMMTLHGSLAVSLNPSNETSFLPPEGNMPAPGPMTKSLIAGLTIDAHSTVLTESGDCSEVSYNVKFDGDFGGRDSVSVRLSVLDSVYAIDDKGKDLLNKELVFVDEDGEEKEVIVLTFKENERTKNVLLKAKSDNVAEDYGYVTVQKQKKIIDDVDGAVYAFGMGKSIDLNVDSPSMLSYAHDIDMSGTPEKADKFNEKNEYDASKLFDIDKVDKKTVVLNIAAINDFLKGLKIDLAQLDTFKGKTVRFVANDSEGISDPSSENQNKVKESAWIQILDCKKVGEGKYSLTLNEEVTLFTETNSKVLISGSKDYLFIDEDNSVDRLFVNNQDDNSDDNSSLNAFVAMDDAEKAEDTSTDATTLDNIQNAEKAVTEFDSNAIRFNHNDIGSRGIAAAQMEYGEYNLGTGKDHVEINKSLYRDDAFRTFTVVNTGDDKRADKDTNTVDFGYEIGSGSFVSRSETEGAEVPFHYNFNVPEHTSGVNVTEAFTAENIYYVEAKIKKLKNGSTTEYESTETRQRREIIGKFSSVDGFNIKYDFILADDEAIEGFVFYCAEFDDEIVINKHESDREDSNSTVICSGTKVSKNVSAPAEESAATEAPVVSEEPAAEGDMPAATEETGTAESESSAAATPAETETTGEEGTATADAEKPAGPSGNVYSFTMNADDLSQFKNKYAGFGTAKKAADEFTEGEGQNQKTRTRDTNAYAFNLYVDATMSDGSVQRRVVNGMTENTFGIDRDFTLSAGVTIVSVKFAYGYKGDGQLVINAQSGNDKIDASSNDVTRNDMVVFGGLGDDYITMNKGGIAFGDRGQVKYDNGKVNGKEVHETVLGSILSEDGKTYYSDYTTGIDKRAVKDALNTPEYRLQTDGVNRDAKDIHSVDDAKGGVDMIYVGGTDSVVIGGAEGDVIAVGGDKNVVLGDNGHVIYKNATNANAVYGDELGLGLYKVETTSDAVGDVDNIVIAGNKNVAMGGDKGDSIRITGADNVAIGDAGRYTVEKDRLYAESKQESDHIGGKDYISTGDGKNAVIGGTDNDKIRTGAGNDAIIGDGGIVIMDTDRNMLMVSNEGRNINKQGAEDGSAGVDDIEAGDGDNVVFGGLNKDYITTGSGKDVVFGDNAYATFQGNYKVAAEEPNTELPTFQTGNSSEEKEIKDTSILSFNFTGDSDKRITPEMEAGVESAKNWNNISGHLSGTYGNNDNEIVRFDDGTRASAISVSYGGHENHRNTSTDSRINLQGYNHWFNGNDGNTILMNSGLMSTAPNQQCGSLLEVSVDGLAQYYESYDVIVYLDIPDSHSSYNESVRKITLSTEDGKYKESFYIDDRAEKTFSGSFVRSYNDTAEDAIEAVKSDDPKAVENYVVFRVDKQFAADRIIIKVEDGLHPYSYNGKDLPGIAGLQIKGDLHKQDVAVSTDIDFGGNDVVDTNGGDDIVVGGTGNDVIVTYGDERYSIDDNDVVYGDNAKLLFADRDNNPNTATTLTKAESIVASNLAATYDDAIRTGDGNDVVVGGIGSDAIFSGDVKTSDNEDIDKRFDSLNGLDANKNTDKVKLDNLDILSFNFTANNSGDEARVDYGVAAGVVVDDDWHDFYRNDRGILMCDDTKAGWPQNEYEERVNKIANEHEFNTFATVNGVNVDLYGRSVQNYNSLGLSAYTQENAAELDGDTANSKIFNSSLALHSQEEIILKLSGLNNYLADKESGETKGDQKTYDVYVYLGGDNDNSDTYNFVYDVYSDSYGNYAGEHRYVNDWVGHFFDGDYREATCKDADKARVVAKNGVTPRVEMIGNYVVFRGVTGDKFTVHIRNYNIPETNQWPKNLPVITAVQIVTGKGRFELNEDGNPKTNNDGEKVSANVAIGGDHDKDLVFGDDAYLEFDFDIPYGVGENINDFQNRVVSANSMAIKHDDAVKVDTRDIIYTGKDRDVVVGGEDADTIKTGAADDVVVGDNANLMMEHNNPIGVFTPSNEITLDDHTIDTSTKEDYLGHDNVTVETIQRKYDPNWGNQNNGYMGWGPNGWGWYSYNNNTARGTIDGIKEPVDTENTGRKDNIVDDEGSNLLIEGQWGTEKLYDPESLQPVEDPNVNTDDPNNGNEDPNVNTDDPNNGNEDPNVNTDDPNNGNEDPNVNTDDPNNENQDLREVFVGNMYGETKISIGAGETIKLVITNWDKGDQWYTPNIGIKVDASGRHSLVIKWDELGENASQEQSGNPEPISFENVAFVDIPNTSNVENEEKIVLYIHSEEAFQFSVYLINLG